MEKILNDIAKELIENNKKVQLIYAFNGTGKTRLSKEVKELIEPTNEVEDVVFDKKKILYYNAFTEDLFYWDNDIKEDLKPKLKIQPNIFIDWIFKEQGQEQNIIKTFQHYTNNKLTPHFNSDFTEITFSYERGNDEKLDSIKISKGEESCLIWSIFYSLMTQIIEVLDETERETNKFDNLEYLFIDDPVSSLDDNHLIELAVDLAGEIKKNIGNVTSKLKFIITTHNPLFYNVLFNELIKKKNSASYLLKKVENNEYILEEQKNDSPFSYHLHLIKEIEKVIEINEVKKYHFNYLRNILEKTATFLGYTHWGDLLPKDPDGSNTYYARLFNNLSHSKHSAEEMIQVDENSKRNLNFVLKEIKSIYKFK